MKSTKVIGLSLLLFVLFLAAAMTGALADRLFVIKPLDLITRRSSSVSQTTPKTISLSSEQASVIDTSEHVSPSVVTVAITKQQRIMRMSPFMGMGFDPFGFFGNQNPQQDTGKTEEIKQDIGSGFVVDKDGLIVTNKHVVSDTDATYRIITKDDKEYAVKKIYRDPINDLAILKVEATLPQIELGDSDQIKVGQFVIAIGTALGEFRHTVTTGVISGLGRGITAGDGGALAEKLDNVIQTDAAINPGNSGGPLMDSTGHVIGVNVAVAQGANGIGFALPINVVKESLKNFEATGKFSRPFMGVQYRMIPKQTALLNDVPAGALIIEIVKDSPAEKAGLQKGDILVKFGDIDLTTSTDQNILSTSIAKKKVGDKVSVEYIRDGKKSSVTATLQEAGDQ